MRKRLILGQAFLLFFILIFFFFLWFQVKGNPLLYLKAGRAIQDYYEEYYQDLDLKKGEITYHQDDQRYTNTYTNQEEPLLNFTITYHKGKITSNYEENYENGKELLEDRSNIIKEKIEKACQDTIYQVESISFEPFQLYSKQEQEEILQKKDLSSSSLYQLTLITSSPDFSFEDSFPTLTNSFNKENIKPKTIELILKNQEEERTILLEKGDDETWQIVSSAKS